MHQKVFLLVRNLEPKGILNFGFFRYIKQDVIELTTMFRFYFAPKGIPFGLEFSCLIEKYSVAFLGPSLLHTQKSFRNLIKSNRNQIVFTIFRLIWIQTDVRLLFQINRKMESIVELN